ncbi:DNA-directed RNA polymerase [Pseudomassariella vexata]|uniref:DNA-directed RNA polymerases I and III subunit RPAC2 n=1 Tax=Pseudomassariella vexata TaxID=1141098 RepID=A0A1Y2EED0_9PEZI|nr:DNA-directed RNA polymerase [Pseudomassariella vexata]ORY69931.1 DNA-directed RNA polymerase [Pseudomassariella vexata]
MPGRTINEATRLEAKTEDVAMADAPTSAQSHAEESHDTAETMREDGEENGSKQGEEEEDEEEQPPAQRIRVLPGSTTTAASYEFLEEGHTLGNALRYIIMKNPDVEFCAYAIPHPSEPKMNVRIQTYDTTTAIDALKKGLQDLEDLCDVVAEEFWTKRNEFAASKADMMSE